MENHTRIVIILVNMSTHEKIKHAIEVCTTCIVTIPDKGTFYNPEDDEIIYRAKV